MRREQTDGSVCSGDEGVSLDEMLVGMFLTAVLGLIVMQAFIASSKGARHVADDALVQQQQQTAVERMTRDLRLSRSVDASSGAAKVVVWVDLNSDYAKQLGETITWELGLVGGKCQLSRTTNAGVAKIIATAIPTANCGSAFSYYNGTGASAGAVNATRIDVLLTFQAPDSSATARTSQFPMRMRNVA